MSVTDKIREQEVSAFQLVAAEGNVRSKLGGLPNLPAEISWPMWKDKPLTFICQIDIEEMPKTERADDLLKTGMLFFFYDQDQSTWGFDPADRGSWRVIYAKDSIPDTVVKAAPPGLDEGSCFAEKPVAFKKIMSRPSGERIGLDFSALSHEEFDACEKILEEPYDNFPKHQIGGYPFAIQNYSMEIDCQLASNGLFVGDLSGYENPKAEELAQGASEWCLLLQIDSDDDTKMMWGDCGMLYFWIKQSDLLAENFEGAWMILQCE